MKKLRDTGFIAKVQNGVYIVSPDILIKGADGKRANVRKDYNEAAKNTTKKKAKPSPDGKAKTEEKTEGED